MRRPLLLFVVSMAVGCDTTPIGMQPNPPGGTSVPAPSPVTTPTTLESPEAVMQRYEDARKRGDYRARADCVTPETLQAFAAMKIHQVITYGEKRNFDYTTFQRYGITGDMIKEMSALPTPEAKREAAETMATTMADKPGFYGDYIAQEMLMDRMAETPPAQITGVNIQGDTATAHVVADIQGQPFHADVQLKLINGRWKVDDTRHYRH